MKLLFVLSLTILFSCVTKEKKVVFDINGTWIRLGVPDYSYFKFSDEYKNGISYKKWESISREKKLLNSGVYRVEGDTIWLFHQENIGNRDFIDSSQLIIDKIRDDEVVLEQYTHNYNFSHTTRTFEFYNVFKLKRTKETVVVVSSE